MSKVCFKDRSASFDEICQFPMGGEEDIKILDVPKNISAFLVYAKIREFIFKNSIQNKCTLKSDNISSTRDKDQKELDDGLKREQEKSLSKVVVLGLNGLNELMREIHLNSNNLQMCSRTLQTLLNVLGELQPEDLKDECVPVIESLYTLLMDLSQNHEPPPDNSKSSHSTISSLSCSALLSLIIALGDSGKMLAALTNMFILPCKFLQQQIKLPAILHNLHSYVNHLMLGSCMQPTWFKDGIMLQKGYIQEFYINFHKHSQHENIEFNLDKNIEKTSVKLLNQKATIACEGGFLFIQNSSGLFKVGTGYQSTIKGSIYACNWKLTFSCDSKLLTTNEDLYLLQSRFLTKIDISTMLPCQLIDIHGEVLQSVNIFADKSNFYCLQKHNQTDLYKTRLLEINDGVLRLSSSSPPTSSIHLCMEDLVMFGMSNFEEDDDDDEVSQPLHSINLDNKQKVIGLASGKEFWLAVTSTGDVVYRGRSHVLGLKSKNPVTREWTDLPIIKSPNIVQMSAGHDGYHVLMVSDEGKVFFAGVAKRGEDGDLNCFAKVRRTIKAVRPRKMARLDGKRVVWSACNYATSAVVTKDGQVYMFGKDAYMCDLMTGLLHGSRELDIVSLSLGKAHVVMLSRSGKVYTFGLNLKGQCGRTPENSKQPFNLDINSKVNDVESNFCSPGSHQWTSGDCMVCSNCLNCTAFGPSCANHSLNDRQPGSVCGCGSGDAGCGKCGICKLCAGEVVVFCKPSLPGCHSEGQKKIPNKASSNDVESDSTKLMNLPIGQVIVPLSANEIVCQVSCGQQHTVLLTSHGNVFTFGSNQFGQLGTGDVKGRATPFKVGVSRVTQVVAGSYHTVLLHQDGRVFTCGSNKSGQLGRSTENRDSCYTPLPLTGYGGNEVHRVVWVAASGDQTFLKVQTSLITCDNLKKATVLADERHLVILPSSEQDKNYFMVRRDSQKCKVFSYDDGGRAGAKEKTEINNSVKSYCFDREYKLVWSYRATDHFVTACNLILANIPEDRMQKMCGQQEELPIHSLFCLPTSTEAFSTRSQVAINVLACMQTLCRCEQNGLKVGDVDDDKDITTHVQHKPLFKEDFSVVNRFESHGGGWGYSGHSVEALRFSCDSDVVMGGVGLFGGRGEYTAKVKVYQLGFELLDNEPEGDLLVNTDDVTFRCPPKEKYALLFEKPVLIHSDHWYGIWVKMAGPSSDCGSCGNMSVVTDNGVTFKFRSSVKSNNGTDVNAGQIPQILFRLASHRNPWNISKLSEQDQNLEKAPNTFISSQFTQRVSPECFDSLTSLFQWAWSTFCTLGIRLSSEQLLTSSLSFSSQGSTVSQETSQISKSISPPTATCLKTFQPKVPPAPLSKKPSVSQSTPKTHNHLSYLERELIADELKRLTYVCNTCLYLINTYLRILYPSNNQEASVSGISTDKWHACVDKVKSVVRDTIVSSLPSATCPLFLDIKQQILLQCQKTLKECYYIFYPSNLLQCVSLLQLLKQPQLSTRDMMIRSSHSILLSCMLKALPSTDLLALFDVSSIYEQLNKTFEHCNNRNSLTATGAFDNDKTRRSRCNSTNESRVENVVNEKNTLEFLGNHMTNKISSLPLLEILFDKLKNVKNKSNFVQTSFFDLFYNLSEAKHFTEVQPTNLLDQTYNLFLEKNLENFKELDFILENILESLLNIAVQPIIQIRDFHQEEKDHDDVLVDSVCTFINVLLKELLVAHLKNNKIDVKKENLKQELNFYTNKNYMDNFKPPSTEDDAKVLSTPCRFTSVNNVHLSETVDCIGFEVDKAGIEIVGVSTFSCESCINTVAYEMEFLEAKGSAESKWFCVETFKGLFNNRISEDYTAILFDKPMPITANKKYAVRLKKYSRTKLEGHQSLNEVASQDGTVFKFFRLNQVCGLESRSGQIGSLFYQRSAEKNKCQENKVYNNNGEERLLGVMMMILEVAKKSFDTLHQSIVSVSTTPTSPTAPYTDISLTHINLITNVLNTSPFVNKLLPYLLLVNSQLSNSYMNTNMKVLLSLKKLFPSIVNLKFALNCFGDITSTPQKTLSHEKHHKSEQYLCTVESEHPYKPASVSSYMLIFPPEVTWMVVEFDNKSCTAQQEDYVQMYVPASFHDDPPHNPCNYFQPAFNIAEFGAERKSGFSFSKDKTIVKNASTELWLKREYLSNDDEDGDYSDSNSHSKVETYKNVEKEEKDIEEEEDEEEWISVGERMWGDRWPQGGLVVPGNKICLSLQTASYYAKEEKPSTYGFKCQLTGHASVQQQGLICLEHEILKSASHCSYHLLTQPQLLVSDTEVDEKEVAEVIDQELKQHKSLLTKGTCLTPNHPFARNHFQQKNNNLSILSHQIPFTHSSKTTNPSQSINPNPTPSNPQLTFLHDFIYKIPNTSGARLASWLQPESYIDPSKCQVSCNKNDLYSGLACLLSIQTRDQNGCVAFNNKLKIEVHAMMVLKNKSTCALEHTPSNTNLPFNKLNKNSTKLDFKPLESDFASDVMPDVPYKVTCTEKKERYHSITIMKEYENYSFEELRYLNTSSKSQQIPLTVKSQGDGTYSVSWTPKHSGSYDLIISIDDIPIDHPVRLFVKQATVTNFSNTSNNKSPRPTAKLKQFICSASAGLRIRSSPCLRSPQLGVLKNHDVVSYESQLQNSDGVWLKLTKESIQKYCHKNNNSYNNSYNNNYSNNNSNNNSNNDDETACNDITAGWVLQYHQHYRKTYLFPVVEKNKENFDIKNIALNAKRHDSDKKSQVLATFTTIKCSEAGHPIHSHPSLNARIMGILRIGNQIVAKRQLRTEEGLWVELDEWSRNKYVADNKEINEDEKSKALFRTPSPQNRRADRTPIKQKAWCLAESLTGSVFLYSLLPSYNNEDQSTSEVVELKKKNYDFSKILLSSGKQRNKEEAVDIFKYEAQDIHAPLQRKNVNTPPPTPKKSARRSADKTFFIKTHNDTLNDAIFILQATPPHHLDDNFSGFQNKANFQYNKITLENFQRSSSCSPPRGHRSIGTPLSSFHPCRSSSVPRNKKPYTKPKTNDNYRSRYLEIKDDYKVTGNYQDNYLIDCQDDFESYADPVVRNNARRLKRGRIASSSSSSSQRPSAFQDNFINDNDINRSSMTSSTTSNSSFTSSSFSPVKTTAEAMAQRSLYAAFLWHSDVVHDAMACSTFLKFHASLNKDNFNVLPDQQITNDRLNNSANITSKEDDITTVTPTNEERTSPKLDTFRNLVWLWNKLSLCATYLVKKGFPIDEETGDKDEEANIDKTLCKNVAALFEEKIHYENDPEKEAVCEICELVCSVPVTYHMRQCHPGCGKAAEGQGYNSGGGLSKGWAGNCGDGGIGSSTWYLVCKECRLRYQEAAKAARQASKKDHLINKFRSPKIPILTPISNFHSLIENSLFLLTLSNSTSYETYTDLSLSSNLSPYSFFPTTPFKYLEFCSTPNKEDETPTKDVLDNIDTIKRRVHKNSGSSTEGKDLHTSSVNQNSDSSKENLKDIDKNNEVNTTVNANNPKIRPTSVYFNYKFNPGNGSSTFVNLTEKVKDTSHCFHRSVSEIDSVYSKYIRSSKASDVMNKSKRTVKGLSLLNHPSLQMESLLTKLKNWDDNNKKNIYNDEKNKNDTDDYLVSNDNKSNASNNSTKIESQYLNFFMNNEILRFCAQTHDLEILKVGMKLACDRAFCKSIALRCINWFMRQSTELNCMHDLLSTITYSLALSPFEIRNLQHQTIEKKESELDYDVVLKHPINDIVLAGCHAQGVVEDFHELYQSISDLMMSIPPSSPLLLTAIRCWSLQFQQSDHDFLHRSHVFKNISKILSRSENKDKNKLKTQKSIKLKVLSDITMMCDIEASSHQQMTSCLTDKTTETFWESGDDDRNRSKNLFITMPNQINLRVLSIHIDNVRDCNNKIYLVTLNSGSNMEDLKMCRKVEVENNYVGWIYMCIKNQDPFLKCNFKGPDSSLRIRQIKLLGDEPGDDSLCRIEASSQSIHFKNCESETLKVFKLLTSQVFGNLIQNDKKNSDDSDDKRNLKEHVVGILFSQINLSTMQRQVCSYILKAIQKETNNFKTNLSSPNMHVSHCLNDVYIFELLSLVLALSGSKVGCLFIAQQKNLINDLILLLHISSPRVQRQVVLLLRRLLFHMEPKHFSDLKRIPFFLVGKKFELIKTSLIDEANNGHKGLFDVLLLCIVKSLVLQIKVPKSDKSSFKPNDTYTFKDFLKEQYMSSVGGLWLCDSISPQLAESIISLIKDLSEGNITNKWSCCIKDAISENILHFSSLPEHLRSPTECLKDIRLWMTLASLCVLSEEHTKLLTSNNLNKAESSNKKILCDNHDDDETTAVISCIECGSLCSECDRILHLSKKTKCHKRQVFREEKEYLKVDCHEGCGRIKLFWLLALADSRNLKVIVEFRDVIKETKMTNSTSGMLLLKKEKCRFCDTPCDLFEGHSNVVCGQQECLELLNNACKNVLKCGHVCGGIRDEIECLPCLHGCNSNEDTGLKQDADDMCMICFTDALAKAPAIQLSCQHVFHFQCCQQVLFSKWPGPRITFNFMLCPICKADIEHESLQEILTPLKNRRLDVKNKALMRLEFEGLANNHSIITPGSAFYRDPEGYAINRYAYYVCSKCDKAYYGGEARCEEQMVYHHADNFDASELLCGGCSDINMAQICPKHGTDFLEYKCRYCCSVAVFFCFGTTHFCNACHDDFQRITSISLANLPQCPVGSRARQLEGEDCPLNVDHPATGKEFALGCGICRNSHTF